MSDAAETKPDPTTQAPEAEKPATAEGEKTVTETVTDTAKQAAETAKDTAAKTSDTVFSMFGGGPKKEKKEETDEGADEPSGSSKAQKEGEVSFDSSLSCGPVSILGCLVCWVINLARGRGCFACPCVVTIHSRLQWTSLVWTMNLFANVARS